MGLAWPDDLVPCAVDFYLQPHTTRSESPFNRQMKVYGLSADRWRARLAFRGGKDGTSAQGAYGPRVAAFLSRLAGGTVLAGLHDWRRETLRGANDAADLGNLAASAGATRITITDADALSLIARAGDYIGGDDRAHIIEQDVYADASGNGVAFFKPALAHDIAVDSAVFGSPKSWFRLVDDDAASSFLMVGDVQTYDVELVEDWINHDIPYPDLIPTAEEPVVARNLGDGLEIYRTRTSTLAGSGPVYFDEYLIRNPDGYAGVANGRQLVGRATYAKRRYWRWLIPAATLAGQPTAEAAVRFGLYDAANLDPAYHSGGEGPDFAYGFFGHGRMLYVAASGSIILAGDATNYFTDGNWEVGPAGDLRGTAITIEADYTLQAIVDGDDPIDAADATLTQLFDASGLRELLSLTDAASGAVGWNDSYSPMHPVSHGDAQFFKAEGETAIRLVGDGVTKGVDTNTTTTKTQAYAGDDSTIIDTVEMVYGQPVRRPDLSLAAWGLNTFGRILVIDQPDHPKFYVLAASSAESPGSRVAWQFTGTYEFQARRRSHYRPGGPV